MSPSLKVSALASAAGWTAATGLATFAGGFLFGFVPALFQLTSSTPDLLGAVGGSLASALFMLWIVRRGGTRLADSVAIPRISPCLLLIPLTPIYISVLGRIYGYRFAAPTLSLLPAFHALLTCLIVPIAEELLFRGYLWDRLHKQFSLASTALCTSVLWLLPHADPQTILFLGPVAVLLSLLRACSGGVLAPIAAHILLNVVPTFNL